MVSWLSPEESRRGTMVGEVFLVGAGGADVSAGVGPRPALSEASWANR